MSLTADDGEGEQSDYRNLQAQLDATNRLVKNLSKQLTDLKEQVGRPLIPSVSGLLQPAPEHRVHAPLSEII